MEEWKEYKIGDVCKIKRGASPRPIQQFLSNKGMPWVKIADATATDSMFLDSTKEYIKEEGISKSVTVMPGTLIVSNSATPGLPKVIRIKACVHDGWLIISDFKGVLRDFMYYKFVDIRRYLSNQANGSVFQNLKTDIVREFSIKIPSLKTQEEIVSILKSLDDKIEVNRKINENLEQQAQALFKSWFVDFEPFKNGEFVESEMGMIPKGWRVGTVNDVCCFESGFAFKSTTYKQEGEYRLITIKNVQDGYLDVNGSVCLDELPAKMPQYCLLRIGDILLSLTGNVGRCCFVDEERLLLNQRVAKLKPRIKNNWGYIYTLFRNPSFKDRVVSIARGTAQANLSPIETSNMKIIIPIDKVLEDFSAIVDESYRIMINNKIESRRLAELRDTLLPKLMSGELKVNEIEI